MQKKEKLLVELNSEVNPKNILNLLREYSIDIVISVVSDIEEAEVNAAIFNSLYEIGGNYRHVGRFWRNVPKDHQLIVLKLANDIRDLGRFISCDDFEAIIAENLDDRELVAKIINHNEYYERKLIASISKDVREDILDLIKRKKVFIYYFSSSELRGILQRPDTELAVEVWNCLRTKEKKELERFAPIGCSVEVV